ncbi:type 1 glutamine amidotransferase [Sediminibacterium ginsengisoli]|uniref:GMP synthase-Glutamine amidotransferase n=1 Tax=Sediminibacterium ginsengisoli TaxID=413434 RepID=A0A1T4QII5_9BACT|nr:homoserine O-succinyltransferase [Sediminibacterium ginsengisoli]SKA03078.1 GMP synthase-Glutamine amidotransferase [Sediminibacterium ginsengisoli]
MSATKKIAILDLYEGQPNQGMRCIREIIDHWGSANGTDLVYEEFDVRSKLEVPDTSFDMYISSGGPGSPLDSEGSEWEERYFSWLGAIENWNKNSEQPKKHVFFICHSFQLACRHYGLANVCKRNSTAFGVFPVHLLEEGVHEPVFRGLQDPFYSVDSRDFQVIEPDNEKMEAMGASILAIEKDRPHVPYERAIMGIRFNPYFVGTQFHPEADAEGMRMYLLRDDKKQTVIENHGEPKWQSMIEQLQDPDKILWTHNHVLPNFLDLALKQN